jgi:hypothetical protein
MLGDMFSNGAVPALVVIHKRIAEGLSLVITGDQGSGRGCHAQRGDSRRSFLSQTSNELAHNVPRNQGVVRCLRNLSLTTSDRARQRRFDRPDHEVYSARVKSHRADVRRGDINADGDPRGWHY